jgi:predicted aldo/keto reductase-like oxidoreductase
MRYRKFGKLDWEVSALGFGAMRLPLAGPTPADVDATLAIRMIRHAIDSGVNYVDTAYPYHSGQSEVVVGRALQDGYRERVKLTTKLLAGRCETPADFDRYLDEQLTRLQTDKLDFYLLHGLNRNSWRKIRDMGVLKWAERAIAAGRFDHLGFSFHDDYDVFQEIVDAYDKWALCQIQYNYMDIDSQAGSRGLEYAASKGLAVVVMEPLRGGGLVKAPPDPVAEIFQSDPKKRSAVEWALEWVWNQPEVTLALSGMSTMEQVVQNIEIADRAQPGMLTADDLALIDRVREAYRDHQPIPCTDCGYCQPCPSDVAIPNILSLYNEAMIYDTPGASRFRYMAFKANRGADRCTECNECVEACPQDIPIPEWLKKANALLNPG